ncbi:MAG: helix-turn-helix transcriptional regulator [Draconibacterium sp.]
MPRNVVSNHINKFNEALAQICSKTDELSYCLLPEIGTGKFKHYKRPNWDLYIGDFKLVEDVRFQRLPNPDDAGNYGISFQTVSNDLDTSNWEKQDIKKAAEGLVFHSNNSTINTLWHRNTECSLVHWSFNRTWIKGIESELNFPEIIGQMLAEQENPMFHVPLSSEMRRNIREMFYLSAEIYSPFVEPYLYGKCLELFTQASGLIVQNVSSHNKKQHIHPDDFNVLEHVKIRLINNYQNPPAMGELVEQTGMSKSKLQRLFHATYHTSVYQFIKNIRMEKAMELLLQGYSVTEAGYDIGYSSIPNFSAAFKEHFNQPPGKIVSG